VQSANRAHVPHLVYFLQNLNDQLFGESIPLHLAPRTFGNGSLRDWTEVPGSGQTGFENRQV
jgi:hypothetical protein